MQIYQWLCLFGVPGVIAYLTGFVVAQVKANRAMRNGIQAMLRDRMIQANRFFSARGWADEDDKTNFENLYTSYHALGSNGVMDAIRNSFLQLPTKQNQ